MRFEKPHSLSYQLRTRQKRLSITTVWVRSKVDEWESWLKSVETSGAELVARMPLKRAEPAASVIAALISSTEVSRAVTKVRSMTETFAVGTRIEVPSSLPFSAGRTRPTAVAGPLWGGSLERAAAGAQRRSVCGMS